MCRLVLLMASVVWNMDTIQSFSIVPPKNHVVGGRYATTTTTTTSPLRGKTHHPGSSSTTTTTTTRLYDTQEQEKGIVEFLTDPFPTKIPKEMRDEIYKAEGNTPAAKERTQRVVVYVIFALVLIGLAFFNAFLTEIRDLTKPEVLEQVAQMQNIPKEEVLEVKLSDIGFGWVESNPITKFVLMNKLGGGIVLVAGAGSGILAEAELDSRRQNAERIWEELERRRNKPPTKKKQKKATSTKNSTKKKKRMSGKERKRQQALSEVVMDDVTPSPPPATAEEEKVEVESVTKKEEKVTNEKESSGGGVFGKIKNFYDKADSMAASQALLLNKELEDRGIVDKITDETGLKVIGKDAAAELEQEKSETDKQEPKN